MNPEIVFIDRRKGRDRRLDADPCRNLPLDLYHRKRRKSKERRAADRSLTDDYFAFQACRQGRGEHSKSPKAN